MTTLHDRLGDLADDAPTDLSDTDLWARGRRLLWRRRAVTGAVTLLLVLCVGSLGTFVVDEVRRPVPAGDGEPDGLRLPDRIYRPSPWLPGTEEDGPIGPLVAMIGAQRNSFWSSAAGFVGVATDGGYRFLDLPDRAEVESGTGAYPVLSPDGRYVAYLVTGETTGEPNTLNGDVVGGVGVYDTVTGEARRDDVVSSEHGLYIPHLAWAGDTLLAEVTVYTEFSPNGETMEGVADLSWDVPRDDRTLLAPGTLHITDGTASGDRLVVLDDQVVTTVSGTERGAPGPLVAFDVLDYRVAVSPDGTRLAALEDLDPDDTSSSNVVRPLRIQQLTGTSTSTVVPGADGDVVIGWRDDEHVVLLDYGSLSYVSVDVATGATELVVDLPKGVTYTGGVTVAADALSGPSFEASAPDAPPSPRLRVALGVGLVVLLAIALRVLRRRRARG